MTGRLPAPTRYIPALDGLRAGAVLLVVVAHLGLDRVVPGGFGVTLFFWISGFLLTGQMIAEFDRTGGIDVTRFYLRRALRLLPVALVFLLLAGGVFVLAGGRITALGWISALFYGANYYDLFAGYRSTLPGVRHPLIILWSLAVEEHFYLLWPCALLVLLRWRRAGLALLVVCLAVLVWRAWLFPGCFGVHPDADCGVRPFYRFYKATDARLDSIAWGALVAALAARHGVLVARVVGWRWLQGLALLALFVGFADRGEWFREVLRYTLQGVALSVLVPSVLAPTGMVRRVLEWPVLLFLGRLSYGIYLWHWAALCVADAVAPPGGWRWVTLSLALTALLSLACWYLVERPMLRWRRRAGSQVLDVIRRVPGAPELGLATVLPR